MNDLRNLLWIEQRKALRSRMVLWTLLASMLAPFGVGFLIWVSKNPEISQKLGLVGAKANLVALAGVDWASYASLFGQVIGAGGFFLAIFVISWLFGREFSDGTLKDLLAVPVPRSLILLAKFIVMAVWSALLTLAIFAAGMLVGVLLKLPGGTLNALLHGAAITAAAGLMVILVVMPFALFASMGRGYLLPIALALVALLFANLVLVLGRGEFYPWAIPMIYAEGKTPLPPASYVIVLLTGLLGWFATDYWWHHADQSR
ncbi:MAG TPA: ABC transporter permease [Anaerolineales bacterium]|nr:ABC transporter permease [Anaerolineales bacterium]